MSPSQTFFESGFVPENGTRFSLVCIQVSVKSIQKPGEFFIR